MQSCTATSLRHRSIELDQFVFDKVDALFDPGGKRTLN